MKDGASFGPVQAPIYEEGTRSLEDQLGELSSPCPPARPQTGGEPINAQSEALEGKGAREMLMLMTAPADEMHEDSAADGRNA